MKYILTDESLSEYPQEFDTVQAMQEAVNATLKSMGLPAVWLSISGVDIKESSYGSTIGKVKIEE